MIDIVIPTIPGREESLERCLSSYEKFATNKVTLIVVENSETCGWGWKKGLTQSSAPYVLLACDDQECVGEGWDEPAIEAVKANYIVCPRVWMPDRRIESQGGDMAAYAHIDTRPKKDWTVVNYTTVPFLGRRAMNEIGMLEVHYASDVWVSYRGRQLGYTTCLRHGFEVVHHQEQEGRGAGMSQGERDQVDCAAMFEELERVGGGAMKARLS